MSSHRPARTATGRARAITLAALVVVVGTLVGVFVQSPGSSSSSSATSIIDTRPGPAVTGLESTHPTPEQLPPLEAAGDPQRPAGRLGAQDGLVPDGVTVFDTGYPAVTRLDPALLTALRRAATDAGREGVTIFVNSGWRSAAYQDRLLEQAVSKYGSAREAARWVATAQTSAHVSGDAVDVGHARAASWLSRHGAEHDLCRTYANEPWHYELRPGAAEHGCPRMYADPTQDPRMQQ